MATKQQRARIANMHRRKSENAKAFLLTWAWIQVIGRDISNGCKGFTVDNVRDEILSNKTRYGKLNKAWLHAHLPAQTRTWLAQGKIEPCKGQFVESRYGSAPLQVYRGINHAQEGLSMVGMPNRTTKEQY
jgi:hypothetical protein